MLCRGSMNLGWTLLLLALPAALSWAPCRVPGHPCRSPGGWSSGSWASSRGRRKDLAATISTDPEASSQEVTLLPGQVLCASPPSSVAFDTACVAYPVVLPPIGHYRNQNDADNPAEEKDDPWLMFYYGHNGTWTDGRVPFLPTGSTGLALCYPDPDDAHHQRWIKMPGSEPGGAVLGPSIDDPQAFDHVHSGVGDIVRVSRQEWYMFYFGGSAEPLRVPMPGGGNDSTTPNFREIVGMRMSLGRAISRDQGRTWTKLGSVLSADSTEGYFCSWPRVLTDPHESAWLMIYHAFDGLKWRVYGARSNDQGATWTRTGLILQGQEDDFQAWDYAGIGTRSVTRYHRPVSGPNDNETTWLMLYEAVDAQGTHRLGAATCLDPWSADPYQAAWVKMTFPGGTAGAGGPILEPGVPPLEEWTNMVMGTPYIVSMSDGSLRLYYVARGRAPEHAKHAIGLLISDTGEVGPGSWRAVH